jgi:Domain of unknown function (DUF4326)
MPKVYNIKNGDCPTNAVYIGRGSIWGNPFKIGVHGTREEVIQKFKDYYKVSGLPNHIYRLKGKDLKCYCAPEACHGDFLLEEANK